MIMLTSHVLNYVHMFFACLLHSYKVGDTNKDALNNHPTKQKNNDVHLWNTKWVVDGRQEVSLGMPLLTPLYFVNSCHCHLSSTTTKRECIQ